MNAEALEKAGNVIHNRAHKGPILDHRCEACDEVAKTVAEILTASEPQEVHPCDDGPGWRGESTKTIIEAGRSVTKGREEIVNGVCEKVQVSVQYLNALLDRAEAHPVLDPSAAIERAAQAIAFVSWGERGKEFIAPEYSTHTDGQNSVREHTYKQAEAVVDAILGGTQQQENERGV